ncbi:MAG: N-acetylmuramoyl-L-alanine amidase [Planctomycetes bacterium]|nr:N-acetylmuramoyl-L-alanine amidase [Planctomycetota bacterium]
MPKSFLFFCLLPLLVFIVAGCSEEEAVPQVVGVADYTIAKPSYVPRTKPIMYPMVSDVPARWIPPANVEDRDCWRGIVIHHSAVPFGSAAHEDKYHKSRGWDGLGYHFVINNGVRKNGYGEPDGLVEVGYRWTGQMVGSHCRENGDRSNYWNKYTIGICLVGNFEIRPPTKKQMQSLLKLIRFLQDRYDIANSQIKGHGDVKATKCPGKKFPMSRLKSML